MTRPRHPCPDANQAEIICQVERCGAVVCNVSSLPIRLAGCDLYVFDWSLETQQVEIHAFEVKMPGEMLTTSERKFWARVEALGAGNVLHRAECVEDVLQVFGRTERVYDYGKRRSVMLDSYRLSFVMSVANGFRVRRHPDEERGRKQKARAGIIH